MEFLRVRRICLVGAGFIAAVHAEALTSIPGVTVAAIVDPNEEAARRLAGGMGGARVYGSATEALRDGDLGAAHILVPPDIHHEAALPFLQAGVPVLVEKPLAVSTAQCRSLLDAASRSGTTLGVNQNFVFHPAFQALQRMIGSGRYGRPAFVDCVYSVPLAQLAVRQFGHWMFNAPLNILLEQAVHPLSQIVALAGPVQELRALADRPMEIAPGLPFFPATTVTMACASLPAQLRYAVGQNFPFWRLSVVCDDGVVVADILANRAYAHARTRWLEVVDGAVSASRSGAAMIASGWRNLAEYGLSQLRLKPRSDPFFRSMRASLAAFHAALDGGPAFAADGAFGAELVETCKRIHDAAFEVPSAAIRPAAPTLATSPAPDVALLGGTGFIGAETVRRFVGAGQRVAVMARAVRNLAPVFADPRVSLHRGDIRDGEAVQRAIANAPVVVNLAHGGGGADFEAVRRAMVGGAEIVARACLAAGVRRLVHVGSIASLYLGPDAGVVTGATPSDPRAEERADYSSAKAIADALLLTMHAKEGLPVVILRPGLVVGEGSPPLHAGLGFSNNDQDCIGWNDGRNPLPFVLVGDVAEAILLASRAKGIEGRCFNLVGDVRPCARDYVADLARATERPLRFHPQSATALWLEDLGKWVIKRAGGRKVPLPSRRELVSRGLLATFDCGDAKRDLGWCPVADPVEFARQAIAVHGRGQTAICAERPPALGETGR
jgi:predicted dehydrogenase/nucleoside-diphosphate-sugar epimerase